MKTIKFLIMSLAILLAGTWNAEAEEPQNTLDILTSVPVWIHDCSTHSDEVGTEVFFSFGKKTGRHIIYWKGMKMMDATFSYYLDDNPVTEYNKKNEGKVQNGKYITIIYTSFGSNNFMADMLTKQGVDPNKPSPPSSHEIMDMSAQGFGLPSLGVDGMFVPCTDFKAEEKRLVEILKKNQNQQ